jgi:cytochrome c-type biogenesis protein CcmH
MHRFRLLLLGLMLAFPLAAKAVQPDEILADSRLEARARELSAQLRCMVCQNQSIDDSEAPLARDLRILVRERLQAGDSNEAVMVYLRQRYGDFILLKPPLKLETLLLWAAPFLVLAGGALALLVKRRRQRPALEAAHLTADEKAKLSDLLEKGAHGEPRP